MCERVTILVIQLADTAYQEIFTSIKSLHRRILPYLSMFAHLRTHFSIFSC